MVSMQVDENSPSPQSVPSPQCVGREFVRQYYTLLAEAPKFVHRFYSNESIFVHGSDADEVIGQSAIQNKIRDMSFDECRTRIRALDAHETLGKGVVVQVVGEITVNGGPMRRFVQTFVLAPQSEKKYYVHNDIFRYEDELFGEKLPHENGAPADPDAEKPVVEQRSVPTITNGDSSFQNNGEKVRHDSAQETIQNMPPCSMRTSIPSSGFSTTTISTGSNQGDAASTYQWVPSGNNASGAQADEPASGSVPNATAAYDQVALPQRQPKAHPTLDVPNPQQSSIEPPPEPSSAMNSAVTLEQPQASVAPQSSEKPSPVPSEEREESVDTGPADKSWASRVKHKPGPPQQHHQQQPQQPATQVPGTSAPPNVSPVAGSTSQPGGYPHQDLGNRQAPQPQNVHPSSRQPYNNQGRSMRQQHHGTGSVSQDVRFATTPGGHPANFTGGGNRSNQHQSAIDTLPIEQQAYIRNIPGDANEANLKEFFESAGYGGVVEIRIRRKNFPPPFTGFVAFDSVETAQKLIQQKSMNFHNTEIHVDVKRPLTERSVGGGGGNFSHVGPRQYSYPNPLMPPGNIGRGGGQNIRGGMVQRGGMAQNRPPVGQGPGAYVGGSGSGVGGGGGRPSRMFHSSGRGGSNHQHHQ